MGFVTDLSGERRESHKAGIENLVAEKGMQIISLIPTNGNVPDVDFEVTFMYLGKKHTILLEGKTDKKVGRTKNYAVELATNFKRGWLADIPKFREGPYPYLYHQKQIEAIVDLVNAVQVETPGHKTRLGIGLHERRNYFLCFLNDKSNDWYVVASKDLCKWISEHKDECYCCTTENIDDNGNATICLLVPAEVIKDLAQYVTNVGPEIN